MTDKEMMKLCAKAMDVDPAWPWDPLRNDAQALSLVKKFHLQIHKTLRTPEDQYGQWIVLRTDRFTSEPTSDLNRAIVECVAKIQASS